MRLSKQKFYAKALDREVVLYIGIPDDYMDSSRRYPVLYMQDGHNVFLKEDAFIGETWQMLELYEVNHHLKDIIVVALNASQKKGGRMYEYNPFEYEVTDGLKPKPKGGGGDVYLDYLVETIKPMIDDKYRTLSDAKNTSIMGSSLGGLMALYAGIKYSHIFSKVASLSGAFFVSMSALSKVIKEADLSMLDLIYMDTGDQEIAGGNAKDYIDTNDQIYRLLLEKCGMEKVIYRIIPGGRHSEVDWARRLKSIIEILYT